MKRFVFGVLLLSICFAAVGFAQEADEADTVQVREARFVFDDTLGRNIVIFTSSAPLQMIMGRTSAFYGYMSMNLDSLSEKTEAHFECDLRTLTTGVAYIDEDMFSNEFLAVDSFPTASFRLLKVRKADVERLVNEGAAAVSARGEFTLRGITDTLNVDLALTYFEGNDITATRLPGDILKVKAMFDIRLSRFGMEIPEKAFLKLDDRIHVEVDAFGGTEVAPIDRSMRSSLLHNGDTVPSDEDMSDEGL